MQRKPINRRTHRGLVAAFFLLLLSGGTSFPARAAQGESGTLFTVQAQSGRAVVRWLTEAATCPSIVWDDNTTEAMTLRSAPAIVPARQANAQSDNKAAVFTLRACEAAWHEGARTAHINGQSVPAPHKRVQRMVILADTGCRLKSSDAAFQSCNDVSQWPFARIAESAAAKKPDLVLHIGDIHYRESPCPANQPGCANSPWGYGDDAWQADFFTPAKNLLAAAPWVFVRGNHESCFRAGQGWFRYVDTQPWRIERSCDDPRFDTQGDYSEPYAIDIGGDEQLVIFDSSKTSGRPLSSSDPAWAIYNHQLAQVAALVRQKKNSWFVSHHPLIAVLPGRQSGEFRLAGNLGLQSVFEKTYPEQLLPDGVRLALHGHVHLFESISFKGAHPASIILGNSGSANEGTAPQSVAAGTVLRPTSIVEDYMASAEYGFATLDRLSPESSSQWLLTEYNVDGKALIECRISGNKSSCRLIP